MSQPDAAALEFGFGAVIGGGDKAIAGVLQTGLAAEHFQHLVGIILPVCCAVDVAAGFKFRAEFTDKVGLNQAALVVALFGPRVREIDVNTVQRTIGQHVVDYINGIMLHDADIAQPLRFDAVEQGTYTRCEYLECQKIMLWSVLRNVGSSFAHAEADLKNHRGFAAKDFLRIKQGRLVRQHPFIEIIVQGVFLPGRDVCAVLHKAFDVTPFLSGVISGWRFT